MITQKIDLYEYFKLNRNGTKGGYLTVYARTESVEMKRRLRPAMIVLPGGAYAMLSDREGEPVALKFLEKGYVSFVLSYSLQTQYPAPLIEAQMYGLPYRLKRQIKRRHLRTDCRSSALYSRRRSRVQARNEETVYQSHAKPCARIV